ncbi:hypothetical protein SOVF_101770 [Spinacia oleracea]|nr:hypothetical protein SOVF_101770 [Spinacia oleracea]
MEDDYAMEFDELPSAPIHTRHLAEVFTIKMSKINDDSKQCEVYGTILVQDEKGDLYLYNRCPENAENVYENGSLSLIGPRERPISSSSSFEVYFDLKDKSGNELINNSLLVDMNRYDDTPLIEKCCSASVEGKMGVATVTFAVLQVGVLACITVVLVKENDSSSASGDNHVYGHLVTAYERFQHKEETSIVLCDKSREQADKFQFKDWDKYKVPLSRYFVAVPAYSPVIIQGNINCCYSDGSTETFHILQQFRAGKGRICTQVIDGTYGRIKVIVFWARGSDYDTYRDYDLDSRRLCN